MKKRITLTLFLILAFSAGKIFSQVSASISSSGTVICSGSSTTFTGTPSGGTPPYTFTWTPATGLSTTTASVTTASPTSTTVYTLTVTDAATVTATATVQVTVNPTPSVTVNSASICQGGSNPLTASGATTYSWSPGTGLSATTGASVTANPTVTTVYTVTGTSAAGCMSSNTSTLTVNPNPTLTIGGGTSICSGQSTTLTGSGAASYTWSTGATTSTLTVSPGSTTTYTLTGASGACSSTKTVTVNVSVNPTVTISGGGTICAGQTATLSAAGATTYTWSPGSITTSTYAVSPGSTTVYTLTGTNGAGCTGISTSTVTVNSAPSVMVSGSSTICAGATATLSASGATTYTWNTGATSLSIAVTPTASTIYTVTGTSGGGCTGTATGTVTVSAPITGTMSSTNVLCNGMCNGSATITASGGSGGYTYNWVPSGGTTTSISSQCPGTYTATVTDAIGCTYSGSVMITQPAAMSVTPSATNAACGSCNGAAFANVTGGTAAYTYTWQPGGITSPTASALCPGAYSVSVMDANGCNATSTVNVVNAGGPTLFPTSNNTSCSACTGYAISHPTGGTPPYTFSWSPGGATTDTAFALCAGTYTATVTDNLGCITTTVVTVGLASSITTAATTTNTTCYNTCDGGATLNAAGGTAPYSYTWTPGTATTDIATNLCGGNYTVNIQDASGCNTTTVVAVNSPTPVFGSIGGVSNLCQGQPGVYYTLASGGTAPYSYAWYDFNTVLQPSTIDTVIISPFTWGIDTVKLVITDANNCTGVFDYTVTVNAGDSLSGMVTDTNNVNVTSGLVYLFHQDPSHTNAIDTVGPVNINSGYYIFPNVGYGNYFIKVIADTNVYPTSIPTYYSTIPGTVYQWDSAKAIPHYGCVGSNITGNNIKIIQIPATPAGPGQISGHISEGTGFGQRIGHGMNSPFGAPLKGVDIKLGKNPGGSPAARTTSDNNGDYQFSNIPVGSYKIYVDIPNYGMDSVLAINITPTNTTSVNNNYYVDSTSVRVDTCIVPHATYTMVADATPSVWDVFPTYSVTTSAVWHWGDGTSTAGLYPSHTYSAPGRYNICVTVFSVCNDSTSYCQNDTIYRMSHNSTNSMVQVNVINGNIGVNDHRHSNADFEVYPNPARSSLTVKGQKELGIITIANSLGQVVYKENVQSMQKQIDISMLPSGVYIVNVQGRFSRIVKE
ncbi:MAG: T9SS type A sorting domain-containing protein [Bacteroidia bacterium]